MAIAGAALILFSSTLHAEEYVFDISEIEKKPYHFGGYLDFRPVLSALDRDAAWYKLRFYDRDEGRAAVDYRATLQLEGSIEKDWAKLFVRMNVGYQDSDPDAQFATDAYEAFLSLKPGPSLTVDAGKRTFKWGKGYAWNPVAFVDRPKNLDDPDLNLEGFVVASADFIKSFDGPLKTLSVTPVLVPVSAHLNDDFGQSDDLNAAGKVYLLFYDTDIDLMFLSGGGKSSRYGLDFSRNLTTNLEIHGEYARLNGVLKTSIDGDGGTRKIVSDITNWLLGFRYLTATDTTCILEYFWNGAGYTERELSDYLAFVHRAHDYHLSSGSDALLQRAAAVAESYSKPNAGRSYGYLRMSQKDPFGILYWTPAVAAIVNGEDMSFSVTPEISYTGITNVELRLKGTVLVGDRLSEFGEKQASLRVELLARHYF